MNWKWIENELIHCQMNGELNWFTFFQNEWRIELIHCFLKWMVNWMIHQKVVNGHRSAENGFEIDDVKYGRTYKYSLVMIHV